MASQSSIPNATERKSRRTHKNSRDGCPNCKAKRVKCSEELPQCSNCIKRHCRCGYLDFPKEKLDHIRRKNEAKQKEEVFLNDTTVFNHSQNHNKSSPIVNIPKLINNMNNQVIQTVKSEPIVEAHMVQNEDSRNSINSISSKGSITSIPKQFNIPLPGNQQEYYNYYQEPVNNYPYFNKSYEVYQSVSNTYHPPSFPVSTSNHNSDINEVQNEVQNESHEIISNPQFPFTFQQSPVGTSSNSQTPQQINLIQPPLFNDAVNQLNNLPPQPHMNNDPNPLIHPDDDQQQQQQHQQQHLHMQLPTPISTTNQPINQTQTQLLPQNNYTSFEVPNYSDYYDFTNNFNEYTPYNFAHDTVRQANINDNKPSSTSSSNIDLNTVIPAPIKNPEKQKEKRLKTSLPNSIVKHVKFKKLNCEALFDEFKKEIPYLYLPVWNQELIDNFWQRCMCQSIENPVLFSFMLDKSLGLLLSDINVVLSSDYLKNFHNTYHAVSNSDSNKNSKIVAPKKGVDEDFFYNQKTLSKFIKLSFRYYRSLISNIKLYLNNYHVEETIRISMLSSYTSYFLLNSSFESSVKLNYGTSSLLNKFINECKDYNQLSPTIRYCVDITSNHVNYCQVPDLEFEIIRKISHEFSTFKTFLVTGTSLYQNLQDSQSLRDFLPKHDCIEFENFISLLLDKFLPKMLDINSSLGSPGKIKYVIAKDLYEVVNAYYKMIPAVTNVLGSNTYVIQRVFYLIFIALGKALNQVLSSVRCLFNIDISSVMHTKIDFNFESYKINKEADGLNDDQYQYWDKLTKNLLRLISYLNYRNLFYGHYLSNSSTLSKQVIKLVDKDKGIIEILPEKLDFKEKPLEIDDNFDFALTFEHYPQFPEFKYYPKACFEQDGVDKASDDFDYKIGLFKRDFNPSKLVDEFLNFQKSKWEFSTIRLTEFKLRMHHLNEIKAILNETIDD